MYVYLELKNCSIIGTDESEYIRFSQYNWYEIGVEGTYACDGNRCLILESKYQNIR